jgi:hypothetical protein
VAGVELGQRPLDAMEARPDLDQAGSIDGGRATVGSRKSARRKK